MSRSKLRLTLWRWHRRVGIVTSLFVLLVSITGILLNHTEDLSLADKPLRQSWLLSLYGIHAPTVSSYSVGDQWLSHLGGDSLYFGDQKLTYCSGPLRGAVVRESFIAAACAEELLLLTPQGQVIERIGAVLGLPVPIQGLGVCAESLCLQSAGQLYLADTDQLQWQVFAGAGVTLSEVQPLPENLADTLTDNYYGSAITWERVLLDLHSGHLLQLGPWLMDLVGLMLILLAVTGLTMWYSGRFRRRR